MIHGLDIDTFNPRIYYVSKEYYDNRNSLSSHFHPFCVVMYTDEITGSGWYRIEGQLYPIEKGSLVICNPAVYHEKILQPGTKTCEYHIAFDSMNIRGLPVNCILSGRSHAVVKTGSIEERFKQDFNEILEEQNSAYPGCTLVVKSIAVKLLLLTLRLIQDNSDTFAVYDPPQYPTCTVPIKKSSEAKPGKNFMVESVRTYLNENYQNSISIGSMAKAMQVSHVYLTRIFRQKFGETPVSYLAKLRLNMARELLESGSCNVKSAARKVGYEDSGYFCRHFKKHFGFPPVKCRESIYQLNE